MAGFTSPHAGWDDGDGEAEPTSKGSAEALDANTAAENAERNRMHNLSVEDVIRQAHESLLRHLAAKAAACTITHQEMSVLERMLKNNGMVLGIPPEKGELPAAEAPPDLPALGSWRDR